MCRYTEAVFHTHFPYLAFKYSLRSKIFMPHQPHYSPMARQLFTQFLDQEIDRDTLIGRLQEMELQLQADADEEAEDEVESSQSLRIRVFGGDTEGMHIREIEQDLQDLSHPNAQILMRGIAFGLEHNELEVHFE